MLWVPWFLDASIMMTKEGTFTMISRVVFVRHLGGLLCVVGPMVSLFNLSSLHPWGSCRRGSNTVKCAGRPGSSEVPLSLPLHFIPLSLSLLCLPIWAVLHHYLYMYMVAFLALRILYVVALVCFCFCPLVFSPSESLPGKDVLCRLLPRPLPSVCFLFFSFLFRACSPPI